MSTKIGNPDPALFMSIESVYILFYIILVFGSPCAILLLHIKCTYFLFVIKFVKLNLIGFGERNDFIANPSCLNSYWLLYMATLYIL